MNKAVAWANQALDYALYEQSPYIAVAYMKPPVIDPYQASRWIVTPMPTRHDLDQWYQGLVGTPDRYHYLAAFDKTTPEWDRGNAVAVMVTDGGARISGELGIEAYRAAALANVSDETRFWLGMHGDVLLCTLHGTLGSRRFAYGSSPDLATARAMVHPSHLGSKFRWSSPVHYWAVIGFDDGRLVVLDDGLPETPIVGVHLAPEAYRPAAMHAVARRAQPNDARTWLYLSLASGNAVTKPLDDYASAMNALGTYFSNAAAGAMPDVSYWAVLVLGASGPEILHDAALASSAAVGAVPMGDQLQHLDHLVGLHETFWAAIAQQHPTAQMREFLHRHWDPFLTRWSAYRPYLDTEQGRSALSNWIAQRGGASCYPDLLAGIVHESARGLSQLRELAAYNNIPTPDLGTTQHGIIFPEPPHVAVESPESQKVSGAVGALYNGARQGGSAMHPHHPRRNARYHDPQVGHWLLPLALGVPAGALGGYFYRRWQESHPGKYIPWISGETDAMSEDLDALSHELSEMFGIPLDQMRDQLAEIASSGATPDQIRDKVTEIASEMGISVGGEPWQSIIGTEPWQSIVGTEPWQSIIGGEPWQSIIGGEPWVSIVGQALDGIRHQARVAADAMPGRVIGVVRDANNKWALKTFRDADVADDWFGRVIRDKSRFTYAAYFDKGDPLFPHPLNEEIGSAHAPAVPPSPIPRVVAEVP